MLGLVIFCLFGFFFLSLGSDLTHVCSLYYSTCGGMLAPVFKLQCEFYLTQIADISIIDLDWLSNFNKPKTFVFLAN